MAVSRMILWLYLKLEGVKGDGEAVYDKGEFEVFCYITSRTAYDDIYLEQLR
jgi:hypothetical protein